MNIFWLDLDTPGRLGMMPRPRGGDWLEDELALFKRQGVNVLVSMLESDEAHRLELDQEQTLCEAQEIEFHTYPVRDRDVPTSQREVCELATTLAEKLSDGQDVIVHCRGGIGRSGLMAASIMIVLGLGVDEVLSRLRKTRGLKVPETDEQVEWVRRFADAVKLYSTMGT